MNIYKNASVASKKAFLNYAIVILFFVVFQTLVNTGSITSALKGQLIPIVCYMIMAVSLNLVVGISGELSLGHAGFMSVGAFTAVIVSALMSGASNSSRLFVSILVGAAIAALAGFLIGIPVLRLNGDYLAIVTLAFGEIIKNILNCLYVGIDDKGVHFAFNNPNALGMDPLGKEIIKGPMGAVGIKKIATFPAAVILLLVVLIIIQNLVNSRTGRAIMAIRDNRIAAESMGLSPMKYKMLAFTVSASMAGAAGAIYALNISTLVPKKFDFNTSILVLVFVVLGGIGNMTGSLIAAGVLVVLPELLRKFSDYRMLVYAIVLILVMLVTNNEKLKGRLDTFVKKLGMRISKGGRKK
ncbi:MAG: branched-chain amino acid ABC transporter permease [Lachnospiraceae bacterium]|nr:branched-chain amino acid ABC transporter permease [Lachnospiraceae bacterium]